MESISSLQNPRIKSAVKLHRSRGRKEQQRIIVFGVREVTRAISSGLKLLEVFVDESKHGYPEIREAVGDIERSDSTSQVFKVTTEIFERLSYGDRSDGLVAILERPELKLDKIKLDDQPLILVLQAIEKPGNLGAVLRSADACGVSGVIHADPLTDFFHPNSIRASTGVVFSMNLWAGSSEHVQKWLEANEIRPFNAIPDQASGLFEADLCGRAAIVLGNEANGLDDHWIGKYPAVKLPMLGVADSLNVSVTASVMLYEALRQRTYA